MASPVADNPRRGDDAEVVQQTYAVAWGEGVVSFAGKLTLDSTQLRLEGRNPRGRDARLLIAAREVEQVTGTRTNGRRAITLTWRGRHISIDVIDGTGAFGEVLDELRSLTETPLSLVAPVPLVAEHSA